MRASRKFLHTKHWRLQAQAEVSSGMTEAMSCF